MIARLWQCSDPEWWQVALGLPATLSALLVLAAAWLLLTAFPRRRATMLIVRRVLLAVLVTIAITVGVAVLVGAVVRSRPGDPSAVYLGGRWALIGFGWPVVLATVVWSMAKAGAPAPRSELSGTARAVRLSLGVVVLALVPVWLGLSYSSFPSLRHIRSTAGWIVDVALPQFATSECLAEIILERENVRDSAFVAVVPQLELHVVRRGAPRLETATRAFASYRSKVACGRVAEPHSFDGIMCREHPAQLEQLRLWASDPAQSASSRLLAERTLRRAVSNKNSSSTACQ
jgi:hypothetical protein